MTKKLLLFIGLILNLSCTDKDIDLIGIWQDSPGIASGWTDTYQIFSDGTFKFNYNQMICDKRTISLMGDWNKTESGDIILTIKQKVIHEGGELVPASGSCGSEYEIEGGLIKTITIDKPEPKKLVLTNFHIDTNHDNLETIIINDVQYWKMDKNPDGY